MHFESNHEIIKRLQVDGKMTKDEIEEILARLLSASDSLLEIADVLDAKIKHGPYDSNSFLELLEWIAGTPGLAYRNAILERC